MKKNNSKLEFIRANMDFRNMTCFRLSERRLEWMILDASERVYNGKPRALDKYGVRERQNRFGEGGPRPVKPVAVRAERTGCVMPLLSVHLICGDQPFFFFFWSTSPSRNSAQLFWCNRGISNWPVICDSRFVFTFMPTESSMMSGTDWCWCSD